MREKHVGPPTSVTVPPEYNRTVLPNGVRVVTESIPSVRSISCGVWIATGSRDETPETCGISHFVEHMVFKGTRRRRMHHIASRMESVGGYLNAFTSKEYTCFVARSLDEHLTRAIDVTCDLVLNPVFPEKEIEKEKDVIVEEIRMTTQTDLALYALAVRRMEDACVKLGLS